MIDNNMLYVCSYNSKTFFTTYFDFYRNAIEFYLKRSKLKNKNVSKIEEAHEINSKGKFLVHHLNVGLIIAL